MKNIIQYFEGDIPANFKLRGSIAIDTETTGISLLRDRLCVVQIADERGGVYIIKLERPYKCPNLKAILADESILKIFHFGRFDMAMIKKDLGIAMKNVFCTKIASRLVRTSAPKHNLKSLVAEICGVELDKTEQTSDWAGKLSKEQLKYAADDVIYLHRIMEDLKLRMQREKRVGIFDKCIAFLPTRVDLDIAGWSNEDIFAH
ncbi:MAG: ribonuclease D [Alphaproteobacteria bacterium]|nr:ribonuclease D [Alphaproteobacteria bacterium]